MQGALTGVMKVLLHMLALNQSTLVMENVLATQRSLVFKVSSHFNVNFSFHLLVFSHFLVYWFKTWSVRVGLTIHFVTAHREDPTKGYFNSPQYK